MEDDFLSCENNIVNIINSIAELEKKFDNWCSLIVSYGILFQLIKGMNGIILPKADSENFAKYSRSKINLRPIDIIAQDFLFGRDNNGCFSNNRKVFTYKYVILF
jgi:hypothetical protein